jgi:hypothetical protein
LSSKDNIISPEEDTIQLIKLSLSVQEARTQDATSTKAENKVVQIAKKKAEI